jgi:hypothetical protein
MSQLALRQSSSEGTGASAERPLVAPMVPNQSSQAVAVIYFVAAADLGTGGVAGVDWGRANARTGPFAIVREAGGPAEETFTTADQVLLLRRWFSLSVAEAARALRVQRPTIYSWQDGKTPAAPKNLERLRIVFDLAREWRSMSSQPVGSQRKEPLGPSGRTLVDLLSADDLRRARVMQTLTRIAETMEQERARRPASGADLAKRFGFKSVPDAEAAQNVERESSRASHKTGDS